MEALMGFAPIALMQIPCIFFVYGISGRITINKALWTVLACIPILGLLVMYYVMFKFTYFIADSLNALNAKIDAK